MSRSERLTLETGATQSAQCTSCGQSAVRSSGFVYRDGDAHAIYHVAAHGGASPHGDLGIGIGTWEGEDAVAAHSAFLEISATDDDIRFTFADPEGSTWTDSTLLANRLAADDARASPLREQFIAVAELVATVDPAVVHVLSH